MVDINFLEENGAVLIGKGFEVTPIKKGHKYPKGLENWQATVSDMRNLKVWLHRGFKDGGVGVRAKKTPAIDVDVYDEGISAKIADWLDDRFMGVLKRYGERPKFLSPFRAEKPFSKKISQPYIDPEGRTNRIEVLGDGQQFVAFAYHPKTKKPFEWEGPSLLEVEPTDLPVLTEQDVVDLFAFFDSIIPESWSSKKPAGSNAVEDELTLVNERMKDPIPVSADKIKRSLTNLDCDDYDSWVKTGMALYHQFDGSEEGFNLWETWSQSSDSYEPDEDLWKKWLSFKADILRKNPVTAASILAEAKDAVVPTLDDMLKRYIYVECGDSVCDLQKPPHYSMSKMNEFKNKTAAWKAEISAPTKSEPDKTKQVPLSNLWLTDLDRLTAEGEVYLPGEGRLHKDEFSGLWVNTFYTPDFSTLKVGVPKRSCPSIKTFIDHLDFMLPIENERVWFEQWLAFNLQKPEVRCKVTPLLITKLHGTGKGFFVELLESLLGSWNCTKTDMEGLAGVNNNFTDYFHRSLLCSIEEVRESNKKFAVSDKIRSKLTEKRQEINLKFGQQRTVEVYTNMFMQSNHTDALFLTENDRRINVLSGALSKKDPDYYTRLYGFLESRENLARVHNYLMSIDLENFNWQHSFDTPGRRAMIFSNQSITEALFWALMDNPPAVALDFKRVVEYLNSQAESESDFESSVDEKELRKLLNTNCERLDKPVRLKSGPARLWFLGRQPDISLDAKVIKASIESFDSSEAFSDF